MAMTISNTLQCPNSLKLSSKERSSPPNAPFSHVRFPRRHLQKLKLVVCAAASSSSNNDVNPYEILGVSPIEGFDMIKAAYSRKRKEAERRGDEATASKLERAYDKVMMAQLTNRKKGLTFGSFQTTNYIAFGVSLLPCVIHGFRPSAENLIQDSKKRVDNEGSIKSEISIGFH